MSKGERTESKNRPPEAIRSPGKTCCRQPARSNICSGAERTTWRSNHQATFNPTCRPERLALAGWRQERRGIPGETEGGPGLDLIARARSVPRFAPFASPVDMGDSCRGSKEHRIADRPVQVIRRSFSLPNRIRLQCDTESRVEVRRTFAARFRRAGSSPRAAEKSLCFFQSAEGSLASD